MNVKTYIPLVMAVGLGLVALVVARKTLSKGSNESNESMAVVVAKRDVAPGTKLTADDVQVRKVAAGLAPEKSFRDPKDVLDRTVLGSVAKGEAVLGTLLADDGAGTGVAALIEKGYRAMTVEVSEITGVAGLLVPGAHVDVIAVVRDERTPVPMARTVLQNIKVTAVGRALAAPTPGPDGQVPPPANNVTLMVTTRQAQILQLVSQAGRPWLVLRNGRDDEAVTSEGVTLADIRGGDREQGAAAQPIENVADHGPATRPSSIADLTTPPRATARVVKIIRGGVESEVSIPVAASVGGVLPTPRKKADPFDSIMTGGSIEPSPD